MISIVNYGMGNLASIQNMFRKVGVSCTLITTAREIAEARALVIPGVGRFDHAMGQIEAMGLRQSLDEAALSRRIPILGICLGMQLMTRRSDEGQSAGLAWMKADVHLVADPGLNLRVPHMGWNTVTVTQPSPYFDATAGEQRFYFVHSYAVYCDDSADVLATTRYADDFVCAFAAGNLVGVQFHPEKSHAFGARFLRRYAVAHGLLEPEASLAREC